MNDYVKLAEYIFPDVTETVADLEARYPARDLPEGAMVTRFAPSPTGFLHTGSLFASLICYKMAKQTGGVFYIRLEDTDQKRLIVGSGESLINELHAFGVDPDEGYLGEVEKGNYGPYCQSAREKLYRIVIKEMMKMGRVYPCFCTPDDLSELRAYQEANKLNPGYYGEHAKCRNLSVDEAIAKIEAGEHYVLRFRSNGSYLNRIEVNDMIRGHLELAQNDQDIVVLKSDGLPTYHFAHLVDDHFMHTTHVIRGEEWLASLPLHLELFDAMGWPRINYAHLPVIMKLDEGKRRKLSKRKDPEAAVSYFLEEGYPVSGFIEYLLTIANSNYEEWRNAHLDEDKYNFMLSFDKMTLDGALFDLAKVKNICKERLAHLNKVDFTIQAYDWACKYSEELKSIIDRDKDYFMSIINIEREKDKPRKDYEKYSDILPIINFMYDDYYEVALQQELPWNPAIDKNVLKAVLEDYANNMNLSLSEEEWFEEMKKLAPNHGFCPNVKEYKKNKEAYLGHIGDFSEIIRIAISGKKNTPNLYNVLTILGEERVKERFNKIYELL